MAKEGLGLEITELRLGLPGDSCSKKRDFSETVGDENSSNEDCKMNQSKTQIVGWPPVCSYRKKNSASVVRDGKRELGSGKLYVKVSKDGAPFLRKIDLKTHEGYSDLALAFEELFGCLLRDSESSEYVPIYEDKDGDWMLVGDVPWEMFTESCKRLRIMKRTEAGALNYQFGGSRG